MRIRAGLVALALLAPIAAAAAPADGYANKPLRLIVPTAPGGSTDVVARIAGAHLAEHLGTQVVVDNRPGAGGAIGVETAFPVLYTRAVGEGLLPLARLVEALTAGPSRIAGRPAPTLRRGAPLRANVLDVATRRRVERSTLRSRSHNCPFHGMDLAGWPIATLVGDHVIRPASLPTSPERRAGRGR